MLVILEYEGVGIEAVVLAAGLGTRFAKAVPKLKLAADVGGVPLMHYPLTSLTAAGVERVVVVANVRTSSIIKEVVESAPQIITDNVDVEFIINKAPERGNGYSLLLAIPSINESRFIVSMADHIYPPRLVKLIYSASGSVLGGDSSPKYIDVRESTKIHVEDGRVSRIGKDVRYFEYVDVGVHVLERDLNYRKCSVEDIIELSSLLECLARDSIIRVADVAGTPWTEVDTYEDYLEVTSGSRRPVVEEVLSEWRDLGISVRK
ncbi:MAG: NTP transferase domain-containing protein [Desulfurococcales archaeon]|nr:NTP transferase domain-containing protein [Desulfurococcales archaeon]